MASSIDLHMHSLYSDDGEFMPAELVRQCQERGITVMAIADHNCVRAHDEGQYAAAAAGITYIPAIEIDCTFHGVNFHVLGYGIAYDHADFALIEQNITEQSRRASQHMLQATRDLGFQVTADELATVAANCYWLDRWTGEMFAEVLLNKPEYADHPLLRPYRPGGARSDNPYVNVYWDLYAQGKPCYAEITFPPLAHAVDIIHRHGGQAVLAHPGVNLQDHADFFQPILHTGIDGLEAFSSYHTPEQSSHFYQQATANNVLVTCGSDYHGKIKPAIALGHHGCPLPDETIQRQLGKMLPQ